MTPVEFIARMRGALERDIPLTDGQPSDGDLEAFFGTLRGDLNQSLRVYSEYARAFYIHAARVPDRNNPDVDWPGESCDSWEEVAERPQHERLRIVDCEGYAFIAARLLSAAGWRLKGFQIIYILNTRFSPQTTHLVSVLENPASPAQRVFVGSPTPRGNWLSEATQVFPRLHQNAHLGPLRPTSNEAVTAAAIEIDQGPDREVAPLREPRSHTPDPPPER